MDAVTTVERLATASGTFALGGSVTVHRLGFGAMRLTGPGIWGPPRDRQECVRVLHRAVELGVDFIDTADSYGPYVSEELIREALHPYAGHLLIATKAGFVRTGPDAWHVLCDPPYLRQQCEMSLRRLGLERIDLLQLHRIDHRWPLEEQVGELRDLQREGKIRFIGLSEVSVEQVEQARRVAQIVSVQNRYNVVDRAADAILAHCERHAVAFIPWYPIAAGDVTHPPAELAAVAHAIDATPVQVALAWLLQRSPVMLPIPGTGSVRHLEENVAAATVGLSAQQMRQLDALAFTG
jgi:aryl-alcohol dehydrogenase-like predicted oxidoreductase